MGLCLTITHIGCKHLLQRGQDRCLIGVLNSSRSCLFFSDTFLLSLEGTDKGSTVIGCVFTVDIPSFIFVDLAP